MQSFVDVDGTFGGQPRELGAVLARIDTGRGQEQLFLDQRPELLKRLSENALEQRIFDSRNTYYDRLYRSQRGWHEQAHDIWPWTSYLAQVVSGAYDDFEHRVAAAALEKGSKQDRGRRYILEQAPSEFRRRDIEQALPEVSPATIRLVLNELRDRSQIAVQGAGPGARWRRL